ncbi:MAG: DUF7689 domain-containing protein [Candidatus Dormibacteria bacterium]
MDSRPRVCDPGGIHVAPGPLAARDPRVVLSSRHRSQSKLPTNNWAGPSGCALHSQIPRIGIRALVPRPRGACRRGQGCRHSSGVGGSASLARVGPIRRIDLSLPKSVPDIEAILPGLTTEAYDVTSEQDGDYNCIAWAAGRSDTWFWPWHNAPYFWPPNVPADNSLSSFVQMFSLFGYAPCTDGELEEQFEKVAIYALGDRVTHAARQLPGGRWASKLGPEWDIEHRTPAAVEGLAYGRVVVYLRRAMSDTS